MTKRGPYKKAQPIITDNTCDYGCGEKATHINGQGKFICNASQNKCPAMRRKNSDGILCSHETMGQDAVTQMYRERYIAMSDDAKTRCNHTKGKNKETYEPLARGAANLKEGYSSGRLKVPTRSEESHRENGKKISAAIIQKIINDEWHFIGVKKNIITYYNGIAFHSSWEVKYAQWLDYNNIKWERNRDWFPYGWNGKEKKYLPDFYLPESDEYIEIKGRKLPIDDAKWTQFPSDKKLTVLMKPELNKLGIKV